MVNTDPQHVLCRQYYGTAMNDITASPAAADLALIWLLPSLSGAACRAACLAWRAGWCCGTATTSPTETSC